MERQSVTVLLCAVSLLLTFTGLVFAKGSAATRRRLPKHSKSVHRAREPRRGDVTAHVHSVIRRKKTSFRTTIARRVTAHELKSINHFRSDQRQIRKGLVLLSLPVSPSLKEMAGETVEHTDANISSEVSEQGVPGSSDQAPQTVRTQLVAIARKFLGLPYRWGGMSERRGVDCSGMVKMLFAKLHINLPRSSREQIQSGQEVTKDDLKVGDLVFFTSRGQTPTHVGVYVGNNQLLHAASKERQVIISDLNQPWFNKRFLAARRVIDLSKDDGSM